MSNKASVSSNGRMESKFRKLGLKLDHLIVKTRRAEADARVKYARRLKTLKARQEQARMVLAKLRRRGSAAGGPLKTGVQRAWSELSAALREAAKRYRETS
jgi:site-specific recombinase